MIQKLLFLLFIISFSSILYIGGIVSSYYGVGPTADIGNALDAFKAENERLPEATFHPKGIDELLAKKQVLWKKELASNGLTLITLRYSSTAYLMDMDGNMVHRWNIPFSKFWPHPKHIKRPVSDKWIYLEKAIVLKNGDLLATYTAAGDTPYGYGMVKVDKDSNLIWKYSQNTHHDFSIDPDTGNILALIHAFKRNRYPTIPTTILEDFVVTLSPEGTELARIPVLDAFHHSPYKLLLNSYHKNELAWDRLHTNSVSIITRDMAKHFPLFEEGQLLLSLRNINTLAVLDTKTQRIVWAASGLWKAQHSPQLLANGNILLLDNKGHVERKRIYSRAIEFNPQTLAVEWSYIGKGKNHFFSEAFGRIQRLPGGNTLITDSMNGQLFEVTPDKEIVWKFKIPQIRRASSKTSPKSHKKQIYVPPYMEEPLIFDPHISGIIVSAIRYTKESLPFANNTTH